MKHSYKLTSYRRLYFLLDWSTQNHEKNHDPKKVIKVGYLLIRVHNSCFSLVTIIIVHGLKRCAIRFVWKLYKLRWSQPFFYTWTKLSSTVNFVSKLSQDQTFNRLQTTSTSDVTSSTSSKLIYIMHSGCSKAFYTSRSWFDSHFNRSSEYIKIVKVYSNPQCWILHSVLLVRVYYYLETIEGY